MNFLEKISTHFIRDRIRETAWADRSYIARLYQLERVLKSRGPHSAVEGMLFKGLTEKYPVEYECIKKELSTGEYTPLDEFIGLHQKAERQKIDGERAQTERRLETENHDFDLWVKAEGR